MVRALRDFWWATDRLGWTTDRMAEGKMWIEGVLARPNVAARPDLQAGLLDHAGALAFGEGKYEPATSALEESLRLRRALGKPVAVAQSLNHLATLQLSQGDLDAARLLYEESLSLAQSGNQPFLAGAALVNLAVIALHHGAYRDAFTLLSQGVSRYREVQSPGGFVGLLDLFACCAAGEGRAERALRFAGAAAPQRTREGTTQ
ncbi:MAG TPA: tetratricopeptide repeat protein [Chloroflexota bacterium]|nr:tetratricopeptide repeat protein [Chloroflexota bacterium]